MLTYSIVYMMISIIENYKKHNQKIFTTIFEIIGLSFICILTSFIDLLTIWLQIILIFTIGCLKLAKRDDKDNIDRKE